ncbi:PadR family transcriptional regulator [Pseudolactococcus plantarum]|uniref:PadR family transcriptional regulator n=1 Tax=Pseudolactococcus plantarum TaxID=1365 RepID=A0A2A5S1W5_9LACT|nr:PadR family transcriptional regulator [Lactococcus plantarum]PCS07432.1 PadR family transcriptional regulator [Lactococcus plantarum]HCN74073.1 PadR family transcriptional regulator [Lactococcus sp.]
MSIQVPTLLLDGSVLAILEKQDMYGYLLTKETQKYVHVSESTMYPVLRRLQKSGDLITYDEAFEGRMRRYYQITPLGLKHLDEIKDEWQKFATKITTLLGGIS